MLCKQSHPGSWMRQKEMTDRINYMNSTKNRVRDTNEIKKKKNNYRKKPFISRRNLIYLYVVLWEKNFLEIAFSAN
jgi:hypothetical protein